MTECEDKGNSTLDWVQYREKCYFSSPDKSTEYLTWSSAESFCKKNGGFLVSIHSLNELRFIATKVLSILTELNGSFNTELNYPYSFPKIMMNVSGLV